MDVVLFCICSLSGHADIVLSANCPWVLFEIVEAKAPRFESRSLRPRLQVRIEMVDAEARNGRVH